MCIGETVRGNAPARVIHRLGGSSMGGISIWQLAIVGILVVLLFGRGKISELMGDVAKGIKSFKKGMKDDEDETLDTARTERVATDHPVADGPVADRTEPIDVTPPRKERDSA